MAGNKSEGITKVLNKMTKILKNYEPESKTFKDLDEMFRLGTQYGRQIEILEIKKYLTKRVDRFTI